MLGKLSGVYESNGDPGCISSGAGDAGGVSYGTYQLATNTGSVDRFVRWLNDSHHPAGMVLSGKRAGSREFSAAWKFCAENLADFGDIQHEYIRHLYYDPAVTALRDAYWHLENHHEVMKDVVWSRAVQYGTGYIVEMFETAAKRLGYPNLSYVDAPDFDAAMIRAIYLEVCKTPEWTGGSPALRAGLYARFENECSDALARLGQFA